MNIHNFSEEIDPTIAERGLEYYITDAITQINEVLPGQWTARVEGSDDYHVEVTINGDEAEHWACDCPYDHGPICKHVAAVLYHIRDEQETDTRVVMTNGKANDKVRRPKKTLTHAEMALQLLDRLPESELKGFMAQQLHADEGLRNNFLIAFAHYNQSVPSSENYKQMVAQITRNAGGRHGFIDYHHADDFVQPMIGLLEKAASHATQGNVDEAFAMATAVMEVLPEVEIDDSDGGITHITDTLDSVYEAIAGHAPAPFKDMMFGYFEMQIAQKQYNEMELDDLMLRQLRLLATSPDHEKRLFEQIDRQIALCGQEEWKSYQAEGLLQLKIDYLNGLGRREEALEIIKDNVKFMRMRMILVDMMVAEKRYDEARHLCTEGISKAKNERYGESTVRQYKEKLLEIATKEPDAGQIRVLAEELFFASHFNMNYFKLLKRHWPSDDWATKREAVIDKIKGPAAKGNPQNASALADIFVLESLTNRLLTLLQLNQTRVAFLASYIERVSTPYPAEAVEMYRQAILKLAEDTGRPVYEDTVRHLKKMAKIEGGKQAVARLVDFFRQTYKNRRAMMEILGKHF